MKRVSLRRFFVVAVLAVAGVGMTAAVTPVSAAEEQFKQVELSDKMIQGFISAQKDMAELAQKNGAQQSEKPDPKIQAELETIAKKHGFQSFVEFDDVAFNISMVMGGLDPQSGQFTDGPDAPPMQRCRGIHLRSESRQRKRRQKLRLSSHIYIFLLLVILV